MKHYYIQKEEKSCIQEVDYFQALFQRTFKRAPPAKLH